MVLIHELPAAPFIHDRVHCVRGSPADETTLHRANLCEAESVCVFAAGGADDEIAVDGRTLLICSTIQDILSARDAGVHTVADIVRQAHAPLLQGLPETEVILTDGPFTDAVTRAVKEGGP